jgi:hypothetical protein
MAAVAASVMLGAAYTSIASIGIRVFNECEDVKESEKWKNMHLVLSNTMVMGIMIPIVLLTQYLAGDNVLGAMALLYGLMGIVGSSVAYTIVKHKNCKGISNKTEENFVLGSILASLVVLIGGGFLASSSRSQ